MTIFLDKIFPNDLGGITVDIHKIEYILAIHKKSFEKILKQIPVSTEVPTIMFGSGKYIIILNFKRNLSAVKLFMMNYEIDIDKDYKIFGESFLLKSISGIKKLQNEINQKALLNKLDLNNIDLSVNDSDFVTAFGNYIEYR